MPQPSRMITQISESDLEGWEVYIEALKRQRAGENILMLAIGDHDFPTPQQSVEACKKALDAGKHKYTAIQGEPDLLAAIARVSSIATGAEVSESEVVAVPGGQAGLYAAAQATLNPGDHAVVVSPHYVTYPGTIRAVGADFTLVSALPENRFEPTAWAIEAAIQKNTRIVVINSPNNPTGAIYSAETMEAIAQVCIQHDLWLISDEVYWTLAGGAHISPRTLPGMKERSITVQSMSKSHAMTGWRLGWLIAPPQMIYYFVQHNLVSTYGMCHFTSSAATAALKGEFGVEEIAKTYKKRGVAFLNTIQDAPGIAPMNDAGGMYFMLDIREIAPDARKFAFDLLDSEKVAVMPGESFGPSSAGHIRVSLCQPEDILLEGAARLKRFASSFQS